MLTRCYLGPGSQYILILQHFLPFSNIYPLPYPLRELLALASPLPAALVGGCGVAKGQRSREKTPRNSQGRHQPDFSHRAPAPSFPVIGNKHVRDDKPAAQTRNRCCILDDLSHRHRSRCNSYIESSKTRANRAVTVVRGAPALATAVAPGRRLKVNIVSVK